MQAKLARQSATSQSGQIPSQNNHRAYDSSEVPDDQVHIKGKIQTIHSKDHQEDFDSKL